jgi:hypothetical protein
VGFIEYFPDNMVLIFVPVGHEAPCCDCRTEITDRVALTAFMPSVKKNIDVIVPAPFYDAVRGRNVSGIFGIYGDTADGPADGPRAIAIAGEERKPQ